MGKKKNFTFILALAILICFPLVSSLSLTSNIANKAWGEDTSTTINLTAHFSNDTNVSLFTASSVSNITITISSGIATLVPGGNFSGVRYVVFTANNGTTTQNSNNVTLNVTSVNDAPVITSTAVTTGTENIAYSYDVNAADVDGDTLTYSLTTSLTGMTISSTTGLINWTPTANGTYAVTASVSDGTATATQSWNIVVQHGLKLEIYDLDVKVDGKTSSNLKDGNTVGKKAEPESSVTFKVEVKNTYLDAEDIEIEDVEITVILEGIDDGDDLEEESDTFNLKAGRRKRKSLSFDLPLLIEAGNYDVTITVEGRDENGKDHELEWTLKLTVDKERHELVIYEAELSSETLGCRKSTNLNVEVINIGEEDEDEIIVEVKNSELGVDYKVEDIELESGADEEDSVYEKAFEIKVPEDLELGSYPIEVKTYYKPNKLEDMETVTLTVEKCEEVVTTTTEEEEEEEIVQVEYVEPTEITAAAITEEKKPFTESPTYIALLIVILIIVLGTVVFAVGSLLKK